MNGQRWGRVQTPLIVGQLMLGLLTLTHSSAQTRAVSGRLAGCITDSIGQPLHGVTVDLSFEGRRRTSTSNAAGCYEFTDLPEGSFVLFARLPGFESFAKDLLTIGPGRAERLDFKMAIHAICECVGPASTLGSLWQEADAVVRLRITGHEAGPAAGERHHVATVLSVLKPHPRVSSAAEALRFVQPGSRLYAEQEPYAIGQEFVIFLSWQSSSGTFVRLDARLGGAAAFGLEDGRVRSSGIDGYAGKTISDLLSELEALSRR